MPSIQLSPGDSWMNGEIRGRPLSFLIGHRSNEQGKIAVKMAAVAMSCSVTGAGIAGARATG